MSSGSTGRVSVVDEDDGSGEGSSQLSTQCLLMQMVTQAVPELAKTTTQKDQSVAGPSAGAQDEETNGRENSHSSDASSADDVTVSMRKKTGKKKKNLKTMLPELEVDPVGTTNKKKKHVVKSEDIKLEIKEEIMDDEQGPATATVTAKRTVRVPMRYRDIEEQALSLLSRHVNREENCSPTFDMPQPIKGTFRCDECGREFSTATGVANHMYRTHGKKRRKSKSNLNSMPVKPIGEKTYRQPCTDAEGVGCPVCNERFVGQSSLSKHLKRDHKGVDEAFFSCDECRRMYKTYDCMMKHKRIRHGYGATVKSGIKTMEDAESTEVRVCMVCNLHFKGLYRLSMHIQVEHKDTDIRHFPCEKCGLSFRTMDILRCHRKKHLMREGIDFNCDLCSLRFSSHQGLVNHQSHVHKTVTDSTRDQKPNREADLKCPLCEVMADSNRNLSYHIMAHHPNTKLKHFECDICHTKYRSYISMRCHRRMHGKETLFDQSYVFACDLCDRRFKKWEGLRLHQSLTHGGMTEMAASQAQNRDYGIKCPLCDKFYQGKHSLSQHINIDHEDFEGRLFVCLICNKSYKHYAHLRSHRTMKHKQPVKFKRGKKKTAKEKKKVKLEPMDIKLEVEDIDDEAQDQKPSTSNDFDIIEFANNEVRNYLLRKGRKKWLNGKMAPTQDDAVAMLAKFSDEDSEGEMEHNGDAFEDGHSQNGQMMEGDDSQMNERDNLQDAISLNEVKKEPMEYERADDEEEFVII